MTRPYSLTLLQSQSCVDVVRLLHDHCALVPTGSRATSVLIPRAAEFERRLCVVREARVLLFLVFRLQSQ